MDLTLSACLFLPLEAFFVGSGEQQHAKRYRSRKSGQIRYFELFFLQGNEDQKYCEIHSHSSLKATKVVSYMTNQVGGEGWDGCCENIWVDISSKHNMTMDLIQIGLLNVKSKKV